MTHETHSPPRLTYFDRLYNILSGGKLAYWQEACALSDAGRHATESVSRTMRDHNSKLRGELNAVLRERRMADSKHEALTRTIEELKSKLDRRTDLAARLVEQYEALLSQTHHLAVEITVDGEDESLPYRESVDEPEILAYVENLAREALAQVVSKAASVSAHYSHQADQFIGVAALTVSQFRSQVLNDGGAAYTVDAAAAKAATAPDPLAEAHGGAVEVLPPPVSES